MIADSNNRIQIILFLDLCRQLLTKWLPLPSLDVLASAATIGFEFSFSSFLVLSLALCLTNFFFGTYNNGIIWNNNILFSFEELILTEINWIISFCIHTFGGCCWKAIWNTSWYVSAKWPVIPFLTDSGSCSKSSLLSSGMIKWVIFMRFAAITFSRIPPICNTKK